MITAEVPAKENSVLVPEERRPAAASHFNGHLKVKVDEIQDDIGAAPHSTRKSGSQEDDLHDVGVEKHEQTKVDAGSAFTYVDDAEEEVEVQQERRTNAPRHLNWHLKVKVDEVRVDNGAVPNSARKDGSEVIDTHISTMTSGNIMKTSLHFHSWQTSSKAEQSSPAGSSLE